MQRILSFCFTTFWFASSIHGAPSGRIENPFCTPFDTPSRTPSPLEPPNTSKEPGLGVEFETQALSFKTALNSDCTKDKYFARKGQIIDGEVGTDMLWIMSGDTTANSFDEDNKQGILTAEYIMNGLRLKLGQGQAGPAAQEMVDSWNNREYFNRPRKEVTIKAPDVEDDGCNKWFVAVDAKGKSDLEFAAQVTVAMPLNAIDEIFRLTKLQQGTNKLKTPLLRQVRRMTWVNENFFRDLPLGIDGSDAEVRGFFSLLLTYAKQADTANQAESPKTLSAIMPRTNFVTMYNIIRDKIPVDLYDLTKLLACYTNERDDASQAAEDTTQGGRDLVEWCRDGVPTTRMDSAVFVIKGENRREEFKVSDWIRSIAAGQRDLLQEADRVIDGQVGALGDKMELVLNTRREAPLFEFRDLGAVKPSGFRRFVEDAERDAIDLHQRFRDA